jgi:hypothetical protein
VVRADDHVHDDGDQPRQDDQSPGHQRPAGVQRHEVVEHRDRGEQEQVHDRVAEPPEDALGEQRVDSHRGVDRLHDHLDQQRGERDGRDDHVDRDHREGDHGGGTGRRVVANRRET